VRGIRRDKVKVSEETSQAPGFFAIRSGRNVAQ
jgi:hypothetical protein